MMKQMDLMMEQMDLMMKQMDLKANQTDHIAETQHRLDVVKAYLPEQASEDDVIAAVNEVKAKVGATTKRDMGLMMKELSPMFKGKFDQKRLSQLVSSVLA